MCGEKGGDALCNYAVGGIFVFMLCMWSAVVICLLQNAFLFTKYLSGKPRRLLLHVKDTQLKTIENDTCPISISSKNYGGPTIMRETVVSTANKR